MLRKHIIAAPEGPAVSLPGELDIVATAVVQVTSEDPAYPIDNIFDQRRGPRGSRWVASEPGAQTLILAFDIPQTLQQISVEVEELAVSRAQELAVSVSYDGGQTYHELRRQGYNFSPPGTTFERETWVVLAEGVTHLRLWIQPDTEGKPCRASLTSLVLQSVTY